MATPPGISRQDFVEQLREEAKAKIPYSVHNIIRHRTIVIQYEKAVQGKEERDVVMDLAQVLPQIEPLVYIWKLSKSPNRLSRFVVFLSDFDELPLAQLLRGYHKKLTSALLEQSGSTRYLTNFACRPVTVEEKMEVADLLTGYAEPFEGASLVIERDREAIQAYEAEYEEAVKAYRNEQANLVEQRQGSHVDCKGKAVGGPTSRKRKSRGEAAETTPDPSSGPSGPSSSSTSAPNQRPSKLQRRSDTALDPISSEDRKKWIDHVVAWRGVGARRNHYDLLREFLSTNGHNRNWTVRQWNTYLKDNNTHITTQIAKLKRQSRK
ncbi:hypothetical protein M407DRAFT_31496 [Tulasnella calospora MUT 4182]|uniref:Uncharacterized protein n=1 Tax=Tulasnella calospora MUT 4182 TaxID=1051891 RepID=A0A0C3LBI9_9AGAM|nr:hypothetical protein M407DRAFT_31496 [Tulasnella calospora MUT 4182]